MQKIKDSEIRYRRLFEAAQDGILILDAKTGMIEDVNPFLVKMLGYSREEFIEKKLWEVGAFKDIESSKDAFEALQKNEYIRYEDLPLKTKDGIFVQVEFVSNVYLVDGEKVIQCNIRDITERKHAENALLESELKFRQLVEHQPTVVYMTALDDAVSTLYVSPQIQSLLGYTPEQWLADQSLWSNMIHPQDHQRVLEQIAVAIESKEPLNMEYRMITRNNGLIWVQDQVAIVNNLKGQPQFWQGIMIDITERKLTEARIQRQLAHLTALRAIDRVIAGNFDLKLSLSEILTHVMAELDIDAADILILNPNSQALECSVERGFRTKAIQKTNLRLGEGYAGRVALNRQLIQVKNLSEDLDHLLLTSILKDENFICYFGVPLVTKGQVKGVLEVFNRVELEPDEEWFDFLNALAGQAAIALENAMLFESLQISNQELTLAYHATIEGWSRALDLRDKETEGHSQRVTEMTVKLARTFGLSEVELIQVRWGSLLHDIGKMGIPDSILLKPGALTEEERTMMEMHPTFAYGLLAPIRYLRQALDIPYCHHEKWDGHGYPQGLKGEMIPLTARIFAVVDVWDALSAGRPYREAWAEEKVREYIRSSSGTHFDPQVVDIFLRTSPKWRR